MASCYSGGNPLGKLTDAERLRAWKWIRDNAIVHGMPFEQLHGEVSKYFGMNLKPEWVNEFLAARKTPFQRLTDKAWGAQADRRAVVEQAKRMVASQGQNQIAKAAAKVIIGGPRYGATGGGIHGLVFPGTHGGALAINPFRWGDLYRLVRNTYSVAYGKGGKVASEQLQTAMRLSPRYDLARRSGVDLSSHIQETGTKSSTAQRTWNALLETRFRMWDAAMDRLTKPGMSTEDIDSIGKEMAVWANHATGSGKGPLSSTKLAPAFFGPKLAQSYWNRLIGDPVKTIGTFTNWGNTTAGEKAVAVQRLQGGMTFVGTYLGMLAANQGINMASNQEDYDRSKNLLDNFLDSKNGINFTHPFRSDWLAFKAGGFTFSLPGAMHSEINLLGHLIAIPFTSNEELMKQLHLPIGGQQAASFKEGARLTLQGAVAAEKAKEYLEAKATPVYGLGKELITGHDFMGRPLPFPWVSDKGDKYHPPVSVPEYLTSHLPIPLAGASKYIFDELREGGMKVTDAWLWMRAAMVAAVSGTTGTDLKYIPPPTPARTRYAHAQVGR